MQILCPPPPARKQRAAHAAGVDVIVSGSGIFGADDPVGTMREMRDLCRMVQ